MKFLLALTIVAGATFVATAQAADTRYYEIKKVVIKEIPDSQITKVQKEKTDNFAAGCDENNKISSNIRNEGSNPIEDIDLVDVILDKIINMGKKIWTIVDAGRPVVNVKVDTANALPSGARCWNQLEGWKTPTSKLYQITYENGFGSTVVTYAFRLSFIHGGSVRGQGQYITLASVSPAAIEVGWGFKFDSVANVPMVFNQGTKEAPVAGMQLAVNWKVVSPLKEIRRAENFFVNGTGHMEKMQ